MTHYLKEEITGMHALDFFAEEEKELVANSIKEVFIKGEANVLANYLLENGTKIPYYFTGIAIEYEGKRCLMGVGVDFSEKLKAQEKIRETTEQLRLLTSHLQTIREEERKRIAREIHDELGQQLTAIKMDVVWIRKKVPEDNPAVKTKLDNVLALLNGSNQSMRRILSELRPGILDNNGLIEALEWQNNQFSDNTGIDVEFSSSEPELILPDAMATCIFRVCQEALTNVTRYAEASKVFVSLTREENTLHVSVEDNGKGFDPAGISNKKSFGILGMKERVVSLGGEFDVESEPGKGTRINLCLYL